MEIEILHIEGCPNWRDTADHVTAIIAELGANQPPIRVTLLSSPAAARVLFAGSPTILIDGADAFPFDGRTQQALNGLVGDRRQGEWANASRDSAHPRLPQFRGSGGKSSGRAGQGGAPGLRDRVSAADFERASRSGALCRVSDDLVGRNRCLPWQWANGRLGMSGLSNRNRARGGSYRRGSRRSHSSTM